MAQHRHAAETDCTPREERTGRSDRAARPDLPFRTARAVVQRDTLIGQLLTEAVRRGPILAQRAVGG